MKRLICAGLIGLGFLGWSPAQAGDVGISVSLGQPGFYGRIDIGNIGQPQLIYAEPRIIGRMPDRPSPIYLRVPPGHERNWGAHCGRYGACGQPVYFVRDDWYRNSYVPQYRWHDGWRDNRQEFRQERREDWRADRRDDRRDERREDRREERRDDRRDDKRDDRRGGHDRGDHGRRD